MVWPVVLGAVCAGSAAWWLSRDPPMVSGLARAQNDSSGVASAGADAGTAHPALYRWRDEAGVAQVTDVPPKGRDYVIVDVAALERRNTFPAGPKIAAEAE